jgi:hypothetical protein
MSNFSPTEQYHQSQIFGWKTSAAVVKNRAAVITIGNKIANTGAAGSASVGVVMDTETAVGAEVGVLVGPARKVVTAGAAFSDLDPLAVTTAGKYVRAIGGDVVVAQALEDASGVDVDVLVFLFGPGQNSYTEFTS